MARKIDQKRCRKRYRKMDQNGTPNGASIKQAKASKNDSKIEVPKGSHLGTILEPFWDHFGSHFGTILGWILVAWASLFACSWASLFDGILGSILEPTWGQIGPSRARQWGCLGHLGRIGPPWNEGLGNEALERRPWKRGLGTKALERRPWTDTPRDAQRRPAPRDTQIRSRAQIR